MHGPQAFANTTPPRSRNVSAIPSRSIVALICSDPGVIVKPALNNNNSYTQKIYRIDWTGS